MGKRRGGGGGGSGSCASSVLRRHIESCKHKYPTLEELVDHLRSNYPHYSRQKVNPLTRAVKRMIDIINSKEDQSSSDISHRTTTTTTTSSSPMDEGGRLSKRKMKLIDQVEEEKLEQLERQHIQKRLKIFDQEHGSLSSKSKTSSSSEEEEDGAVSTSEDAIYEQKVEPKIDLVKTMLRATYSASKDAVKSKRKVSVEEKRIELEDVGSSKAPLQVDLVGGNSTLGKVEAEEKTLAGGVRDGHGTSLSDLGGMAKVVEELKVDVILPIFNRHLYKEGGVHMKSGILLHGPPGCGKTMLAQAIAFELNLPFYKTSATELINGVSGGSEENIRDLFAKAYRTAPSIVFMDEIDVIASKRDNMQREMEKRIVTQLMTSMDAAHRPVQPDAEASSSDNPPHVLVIGATNRPDSIDPALRRPGRFDREIALGVPDEEARLQILTVVTSRLKHDGSPDLLKIARSTPGFVGADLENLANEAGTLAIQKFICNRLKESPKDEDWYKKSYYPKETEIVGITMEDYEEAIKKVQPSMKREGFSIIPEVKWEDVGGMEPVRDVFMHDIVERIKNPDDYKKFDINTENGFLLYGPPGCGKTLIAKAVANEAGASFIQVKGPELLSKYVGDSELSVRTLFHRARTCSPCIIFFDEVDALTTKRGKEGAWVVERLVNQILTELDGGDDRSGVYVIGATNRPEFVDNSFLWPGRLGTCLHVSLPSPEDRGLILKALARKKPIDPSVDLFEVGKDKACDNFSGADLGALVEKAARAARDEKRVNLDLSTIHRRHFDIAFQNTSPSVSQKEVQFYYNWSANDISPRTTTSSSPMDEGGRLSKRKMKLIDQVEEEKLEQLERQHIQKSLKIFDQEHDSLSSQSKTSSFSSSEEEEDGAVSTSENAIYEQKVEPKIDLVKTMLRATYSASKDAVKSKRKVAVEENRIELEDVGSSKAPMQVDLVGGNSTLGNVEAEEKTLAGGVRDGHGTRLSDLGGMAKVVEELKMDVILPIFNRHLYKEGGVHMKSGILLHGPPGCGKTKLAQAIAFELNLPFYKISATELINGVSGGSEGNIRDLFTKAYRTAPSIVFIDEIDVIASKRDNLHREMEKRIVTQLMTSMDAANRPVQPDAEASSSDNPPYVLVIGATNRPDSIDPALRRPGRFDREIALGVPDEEARLQILTVVTSRLKHDGSPDLLKIARSTPGFVGADLENLANEAGTLAIQKFICNKLKESPKDEDWYKKSYHPKETEIVGITMEDYEEAIKKVQPSMKREGFSIIPEVKWKDVGGMEPVRDVFMHDIVERIKNPDDYKEFDINTENGFLLYEPPGCGKTLIAKAVANEAGASFIHVKGPELLSKYVGDSELSVRTLFHRARTCSPCIIFFDEVDALTTKRGKEGAWVVERLVNQILTELDGGDDRSCVYVIGATNIPEFVDNSFLRPGRLGTCLHVSLPSPEDRGLKLGRTKLAIILVE